MNHDDPTLILLIQARKALTLRIKRQTGKLFAAEQRATRKAAGLCSQCGENSPRPSKQSCQICADKQHQRYTARKTKNS